MEAVGLASRRLCNQGGTSTAAQITPRSKKAATASTPNVSPATVQVAVAGAVDAC
jgi:hypothetical protein